MNATHDHVDDNAGTVAKGNTAPMLELRGVDSDYGEVQLFDDCPPHLDADEIVRLIGPNGVDKSTVLKTVFGMLMPWPGTIIYHDDIGGMTRLKSSCSRTSATPLILTRSRLLTIKEYLRIGHVARATRRRQSSMTSTRRS